MEVLRLRLAISAEDLLGDAGLCIWAPSTTEQRALARWRAAYPIHVVPDRQAASRLVAEPEDRYVWADDSLASIVRYHAGRRGARAQRLRAPEQLDEMARGTGRVTLVTLSDGAEALWRRVVDNAPRINVVAGPDRVAIQMRLMAPEILAVRGLPDRDRIVCPLSDRFPPDSVENCDIYGRVDLSGDGLVAALTSRHQTLSVITHGNPIDAWLGPAVLCGRRGPDAETSFPDCAGFPRCRRAHGEVKSLLPANMLGASHVLLASCSALNPEHPGYPFAHSLSLAVLDGLPLSLIASLDWRITSAFEAIRHLDLIRAGLPLDRVVEELDRDGQINYRAERSYVLLGEPLTRFPETRPVPVDLPPLERGLVDAARARLSVLSANLSELSQLPVDPLVEVALARAIAVLDQTRPCLRGVSHQSLLEDTARAADAALDVGRALVESFDAIAGDLAATVFKPLGNRVRGAATHDSDLRCPACDRTWRERFSFPAQRPLHRRRNATCRACGCFSTRPASGGMRPQYLRARCELGLLTIELELEVADGLAREEIVLFAAVEAATFAADQSPSFVHECTRMTERRFQLKLPLPSSSRSGLYYYCVAWVHLGGYYGVNGSVASWGTDPSTTVELL